VHLTSARANIVVNFHETQQRDPKTGQLIDKILPLMQGKFVASLKKYFSDFYRCIVFDVLDSTGKPTLKKDPNTGKETREKLVEYYWQVKSDGTFDAKTRMTGEVPMYIPQGYKNIKYA
jgi:hypothetical protein